MKIFLISIISILVITLFVVGGFFFFAKEKEDIYTDKNFIANVNGEVINLEDFRKKLNLVVKITKIPYNNKQFDKSKFKNIILQNLIEEKLVLEEVKRLGIDIDSNLLETQVLLAFNSFASFLNLQLSKSFFKLTMSKRLFTSSGILPNLSRSSSW